MNDDIHNEIMGIVTSNDTSIQLIETNVNFKVEQVLRNKEVIKQPTARFETTEA